MRTRQECIEGVLLGTLVGDALGLPREGLSRERGLKCFGGPPLRHQLLLGHGMGSDDTEHACMVGQALLAQPRDRQEHPMLKLLAHHGRLDPDEFLRLGREAAGEHGEFTRSSPTALLEISAPGVSKASTLAQRCRRYGIRPDEVMAFGDMPNDLDMLGWAGTGYDSSHSRWYWGVKLMLITTVDGTVTGFGLANPKLVGERAQARAMLTEQPANQPPAGTIITSGAIWAASSTAPSAILSLCETTTIRTVMRRLPQRRGG